MADALVISLGDVKVGVITALGGDRSVFTFEDSYADDPARPTLSLSFKSATGGLLRDHSSTQTRLMPFFSNLLPEGALREYLAERAGVKPMREFYLLSALGEDLPGAVQISTPDGARLVPTEDVEDIPAKASKAETAMRFSLAGIQLKFSAIEQQAGRLTIPAKGVGGDWIVKLPSMRFASVAENEFSMMTLAGQVGIDVPEVRLLSLDEVGDLPEGVSRLEGGAYAVRRFDRLEGGERIHMEDFAQVFGVYPEDKYKRASYRNIAQVVWRETGETGLVQLIRRLVFNALIGNADMHLKNWTLLYRDGVTATLSPAYDLVSTIVYIPDDNAALKMSRSKAWADLDSDELSHLADKAGLPERLVLATARDTVNAFRSVWAQERGHLPLDKAMAEAVESQLMKVPLAQPRAFATAR